MLGSGSSASGVLWTRGPAGVIDSDCVMGLDDPPLWSICFESIPREREIMRVLLTGLTVAALMLCSMTGHAGKADVIEAEAELENRGTYRFEVTVRHDDEGWDHYADRWEVVAPDGRVLGTRTLFHPHETEQPFTRSLSGVKIPNDVDGVIIRARDSVHGYGGKEIAVKLKHP